MSRSVRRAALALPSLALCLGLAGGDTDLVVLKNGKSLRGRVMFEDAATLVLRQDARDSVLERQTIERVDSRARNLSTLLDDAAGAGQGQRDELVRLAGRADVQGLAGEARLFWWRVLLIDEHDEEANVALGHVKRGDAWTVPLGGRMLGWEERCAAAREWGTAWELASLHYHVRTNLGLRQGLDLTLDLERLYRAFFELLGSELRLFEVLRPMTVFAHGDAASYPDTANEFGHYEPETDIVQINASELLSWETLAHEAAHQLLYDTAFRERDATGEIPPWVNEGLAEYFAGSLPRAPNLEFDPGRVVARHFQAHKAARAPLDLAHVLALATGDFADPADRELKYAECYTLVHFLLHGQDQRLRAGFFDYLRAVYRGKGSPGDLRRCLHADGRKLDEAWLAYVKSRAP